MTATACRTAGSFATFSLKHKDARADTDTDGAGNLVEWRARTNPRRPDTDGDHLRDGVELDFSVSG